MNCEEFILQPIEISLSLVKECMRCLVHTILFGRSIGGGSGGSMFVTETSEIMGIEYCRIQESSSTDFAGIIDYKIQEFCRKLENSRSLEFVMSFYVPKRPTGTTSSFWDLLSRPFDDRAVFEKWRIPVKLLSSASAVSPISRLEQQEDWEIVSAKSQIYDRMYNITRKLTDQMDHLPPPPTDRIPYHFDITTSAAMPVGSAPGCPQWSPRSFAQSIRSIPFIT